MRLSLDRLWLVLALGLPALASLIAPLPAVDLAYQVRAGEGILVTGAIPTVDTYTFTVAGTPWTDQQWLAQVLLAAGYRIGGWEMLAVLRALLVVVAFGLVVAAAIARGATMRTAAVLSLVAFALAAPALALRPQLFGIAIFAALVLLVAARGRHPRWLWVAPVLAMAWANLHGSFVLAPVLLGYAWLDDFRRGRPARGTLAVLAAGLVATAITPFGPGAWSYAVGIGADPQIAGQVTEWQRTTPFTVPGLLFYLAAAASLALAWWGRTRLSLADWLWLATMVVIGAWAVRGLAWFPLGAVLVVASALGPSMAPPVARRANRLNTTVAAVIGVVIVAALPWWRPTDPLTGRVGLLSYAPSGLAMALREVARPGDRVFVPQTRASWFEWAVPDATYFIDSRFELFPVEVWHDYEAIAWGGDGATTVLRRRSVALVVVGNGPSSASPPPAAGWTVVVATAEGAIYDPAAALMGGRPVLSAGGARTPRSAMVAVREDARHG
jgi:hypothetical protein